LYVQLLNLNKDLKRILSHGNLQWLCYLSSTSKLTILCPTIALVTIKQTGCAFLSVQLLH
jgi:hypothetical protein